MYREYWVIILIRHHEAVHACMNALVPSVLLYATIKCDQRFKVYMFSLFCFQVPVVHNAYIYIYLMLTSTFFILLRFTPWTFYNGWLINKIQWKLKTMNGSRLHCWNFQEVLNVSNSWLFRQRNILINKILFHMNNLKEMLIWTVINALFVAHAGCNGCNHFREEFDMPIHKG